MIQLLFTNRMGAVEKQQATAVTKGAATYQVSAEEIQKGKYLAVFQSQGEENVIPFIRQ